MNRTLLLIICDFLLLSMLALARFEPLEVEEVVAEAPPSAAETEERELIELLELSLQSESDSRASLSDDLSQTRSALEEREQALREREAALEAARREAEQIAAEREAEASARVQTEAERDRLAEERAELSAERERLTRDYAQTRARLEEADTERLQLSRSLGEIQESASVTQERLRRTQEDLRAREEELARRAEELAQLAEERTLTDRERERAERELEVARAERSLLVENLETERLERELIRREKERAVTQSERLTEGVTALAETSEGIRQEIERSRPQTPSAIFTRYQENQASVELSARTRGLFGGESDRTHTLESTLVFDGTNTYLVFHAAETPLNFANNPGRLLALDARARIGDQSFNIREIGFLTSDPRILFTPVPNRLLERSGLNPFILSQDSDRFDEAVLVAKDAGNFGRTGFRRLAESNRFLRMERPALGEVFSDFASSQGDRVFSRNGEFIGVMVNNRHATVVEGFLAGGLLKVGDEFSQEDTVETIQRLSSRLQTLPANVR